MNEVKEMFHISYFDNEELSLKEHCETYIKMRNEILGVLGKYDIKFVLAETEAIKDLQQRISKAIEYINHFSKNSEVKINGLPDCKVFIGDIEQLLEILGGKE